MIRPKIVPLLERCIQDGIQLGWNRAYKHSDDPDPIWIREQQFQAIMNELYEWFDIDNQGEYNEDESF